MPHWADTFYDFQERHTGWYSAPVHASHHRRAEQLRATHGGTRLLELGSGGGQFAVAAALAGYEVTALDLRPGGAAHALTLAAQHGVALEAVTGDFYAFNPSGTFDLIVSWDGFGIGTDADQRRLLRRLPGWLGAGGPRVDRGLYAPLLGAARRVHARMVHADPPRADLRFRCRDQPPDRHLRGRGRAATDPVAALLRTRRLPAVAGGHRSDPAGHPARGAWNPVTEIWSPEVPVAECMQWVAVLAGTSP
ncbi:class I SAM-dependent methyltransferase [uncultured Deinococcus sp.]|uniref:class I SAM-dependent methyltransferase n=1 Tax=uncultured Deinococcus sp. TaxID=158789 RepID=UPI003747E273